ncbi:hypothetical protein [Enterococcus sp. MMGLQ5-2]
MIAFAILVLKLNGKNNKK